MTVEKEGSRPIAVFVPAFNAAAHLPSVISRIPEDVWERIKVVWVINDGSTDATGETAREEARKNPLIRVVDCAHNRGYGSAVRKGLQLCGEEGCGMAVCLHADGQYPPEYIPRFADLILSGSLDLVQGSRIASRTALSGGMPLYKYVANRVLTFCENVVFGLRMTDYHSGYLGYGRRTLEQVPFGRLSTSFDFDLEVIACARARGLKIGEIPIPTRYADEHSHLNPVTYGLRVLGVMIKYARGGYRR